MTVAVGLSGGVDSSVAAWLLKEQGHEVIGITMKLWRGAFKGGARDACFGPGEEEDIARAERLAAKLQIPYRVFDLSEAYEKSIVRYFRETYLKGETPNPCVRCNAAFKFGLLPRLAAESGLSFDRFATGHYAQVTQGAERFELRMAADRHVVAVSAATPYIMGFGPERREAAGDQFVDVGIAEGHALTYASALAKAGARPVVGLYGTFLQRAFDQLMHDMALNDVPLTLLVFGCSVFGTSDATHLGFFDIPMLGCVPGLTYLAPTCAEEYLSMLDWSLSRDPEGEKGASPVAIRVPAAALVNRPSFHPLADYSTPALDVVRRPSGARAAILALGDFFCLGEEAAREASRLGIEVVLVNPRRANAVPADELSELADEGVELFVTLEDGCADGGFGSRVAAALASRRGVSVRPLGLPKAFLDRYDADEVLREQGLTPEAIASLIYRSLTE